MQFLKWVGSLIVSTIGIGLILGGGIFFAVFGSLIATAGTALAAVVFGAYCIVEYFNERASQKSRPPEAR